MGDEYLFVWSCVLSQMLNKVSNCLSDDGHLVRFRVRVKTEGLVYSRLFLFGYPYCANRAHEFL